MKRIILITILSTFLLSCDYMNEKHVTAKVLSKERVTSASGSGEDLSVKSNYMVFTDKGTYKITDQFFFWKFNSSDIYGSIIPDSTYIFRIYGYRIPFLSMYPNVREVRRQNNTILTRSVQEPKQDLSKEESDRLVKEWFEVGEEEEV